MMDWLAALCAHEAAGTPTMLVTVLEARGSAPREAGAKLAVTAATQDGSIGGGALEHRCTSQARALLAQRTFDTREESFPLGPALGQCCGGHVRVLFEPLFVDAWPIALFGAGHVGRALVRLLAELPCRVRWLDSRPNQFPATVPAHVASCVAEAPDAHVATLPGGAAVLVMTHDHALDYRIVAAALRRDDFAFVGLIGSATKAARFRSRLARDGLPAAAIEGLVCPIGVPGVGGKLPAEIAIAVAAQLLQTRASGTREPVTAGVCEIACETCVMVAA